MNLSEVTHALRQERQRQGISQKVIADRLGLADARSIRNLEQVGANPTLRTLQRYAQELGVTLTVEVETMKTISFFAHAGGVAKSTTCRDLGYILAEHGFRVLLIDGDPQANLTTWLGVKRDVDISETIYAALFPDENDDLESVIQFELPKPIHVHNLHLIPSTIDVAQIEAQLLGAVDGVRRLQHAVRQLKGYDFVLMDPPPSLGQISASMVIASNYVVLPMPPNNKGRKALPTQVKMVMKYRVANPELKALMAVVTNKENTRHDNETLSYYQQKLGPTMHISTPITHRPAVYRNAEEAGLPVPVYDPGGEADREIRQVADELLSLLGVKVTV